jgi:hydroxymethylpyrimidine pyrophosphatase-like HAD family hydrolase
MSLIDPSSFRSSSVQLVAIDMDGTLLDSRSRILPSSAAAVRAALDRGVRIVLATGKARPAALAACREAGLAGDGLLVSTRGPGVFLQGLAVHGRDGTQLSDAALPGAVVAHAFDWASASNVSCVAFLGDECATLRLTPELEELHARYYEPLARVMPSLEVLLGGAPVRKLLFMADEARVAREIAPHWAALLGDSGGGGLGGAEVMQAVPTMLEVVPEGVNKWAGLRVLLGHLGLAAQDLMAIGDGGNDAGAERDGLKPWASRGAMHGNQLPARAPATSCTSAPIAAAHTIRSHCWNCAAILTPHKLAEMVRHAGVGVAMANAVPETVAAASVVVGSNDEGGVAEALERFVL